MNPIEAAKAILEAEKIGVTEGYPSPKDKGNEAPDSKTAPKATNNAGEMEKVQQPQVLVLTIQRRTVQA